MYGEDDIQRLKLIDKRIAAIFTIIDRHGSIEEVLNDDVEALPAIFMLLISSVEHLDNLDSKVLEYFKEIDLDAIRGLSEFSSFDSEGVDLSLMEDILKNDISKIQKIIDHILVK